MLGERSTKCFCSVLCRCAAVEGLCPWSDLLRTWPRGTEAAPADTSACLPPPGLTSGPLSSWSPGSSPSPCTSWSSASGCRGWRTRPSSQRRGISSAFSSTTSSSGRDVPHLFPLCIVSREYCHVKTSPVRSLVVLPAWVKKAEFGNPRGDLKLPQGKVLVSREGVKVPEPRQQ